MGQEYFINNQTLEDKVRELLPSQGGAGAGFDLSASSQIIPIIDLTESAEGSNVRQDLQTALSFNDVTNFNVTNSLTTIINTTGYYRVFGCTSLTGAGSSQFILNDGASDKQIIAFVSATGALGRELFDFVVFLGAGDSLKQETDANTRFNGCFKQIADINGSLTSPT
jgi:hypothetical protein